MARLRRLCPLLLCGLAVSQAGCFLWSRPTPVDSFRLPDTARAAEPPATPVVTFDTRLIEQPLGEAYLTRGVWKELSDPLPHKLSALLAVNGVRMGVRGGTLPADLTRLASAEHAISPTARRGAPDAPKPVPINGPLDRTTFAVTPALTDDPRKLDLAGAECALVLAGSPQPDGRVTVRCSWAVQHGDTRPRWTPTAAGGFDRSEGRTAEAFPTLDFEVTLAPDEVLVVGPTEKADGTLGAAFFHTVAGAKQRAMVLRVKGE